MGRVLNEVFEQAVTRAVENLVAAENRERNAGCKTSFLAGCQRVKLLCADLGVDDDRRSL